MEGLAQLENKILTIEALSARVTGWKKEGEIIGFTNGCFDILHRGHAIYLADASTFSDKLIVGINTDNSVRQLGKPQSRPLQDEYSRALLIASMQCVDAVILFDNPTPLELISIIVPNVLIKGGDYDEGIKDKNHAKYIVGSEIVKENKGVTKVIPFVEGFSTTSIEEKIKSN